MLITQIWEWWLLGLFTQLARLWCETDLKLVLKLLRSTRLLFSSLTFPGSLHHFRSVVFTFGVGFGRSGLSDCISLSSLTSAHVSLRGWIRSRFCQWLVKYTVRSIARYIELRLLQLEEEFGPWKEPHKRSGPCRNFTTGSVFKSRFSLQLRQCGLFQKHV